MLEPLAVLRHYPQHDGTLTGAFRTRMRAGPDRPWLASDGRQWSWKAFDAAAERAAVALALRGVHRGDRVAIAARNTDAHVLLLFALARLRAALVPINPALRPEEAGWMLGRAGAVGVVATVDALGTVRAACQSLAPRPWLLLHDGDRPEAPSLWRALEDAPPRRPPTIPHPGDTAVVIFTSRTSGDPKGVMHSQRSVVASGEGFVERMHLQPDEHVLVVLPLFHVNALFYSVAGALAAGCRVTLAPRFSASSFWTTAAEAGATQVNIIEAVGSILRNRPRSEFRPEHRIRKIYGVRPGAARAFREEFGVPYLVAGYGMTEVPGVTCTPFDGAPMLEGMGRVGRHPDPDRLWAECRVVDEDGRDVAPGRIGELVVRTPVVMQGYLGDPDGTRAAFRDGWFLTGDLVRRDEDGTYFFVSRKKDIIRRRGGNIAGEELDRVAAAHPAVLEAAAVPVPSELGEDDILIAVVPKPGYRVTAAELGDWCRARLAPMKVPRFIAFRTALPHTATHKVAKTALRADPTLLEEAVDLAAAPGSAHTPQAEDV